MRLAAKHRNPWLDLEDCGVGEVDTVATDRGGVECVRLGRGEPIVLLPGLAGGWRLLAPLARYLQRRHEVILLGLRGDRGVLRSREEQAPADHAAEMASALESLRLERPTVLGVSFGGAVALELALEFPNAVGALALYGVESRFQASLGTSILRKTLERLPLPSNSPFLNQFFNVIHGRRPERCPFADFIVRRCWETDQGIVASRLGGLEGFDVGDRLWRLDVPTLVMGGTRDVCVPPDRQMALARDIAGARFATIEGAGHVGFLTHGVEVASEIDTLLSRRQLSVF